MGLEIQSSTSPLSLQNANLPVAVVDSEQHGELIPRDGQDNLAELREALQQAKEDLIHLLHDY